MNEYGEIDQLFTNKKIYRSFPFMINFCEEIIKQSINPERINYLFQTLIKSIVREKDLWEVTINNQQLIRSKNLVLSSSLIAHPRCLEILNINSIPIRDAVEKGKDEIVDSVLRITSRQEYIKRKNYILYVSNSGIVNNFNHQYLQICFSKAIRNDFNFERIIFQKQLDGSMIIVLHCVNLISLFDIQIEIIINSLCIVFIKHKNILDLFLHSKYIDKMSWRASQPINNLVPKEFQWSAKSNIGFCGDRFDFNSYPGVESAMKSSIRLANLFSFT